MMEEINSIINLQKKIVPELLETLLLRYNILREVTFDSPIGRRMLATKLGLTERVLRAQVDFLKDSGLLVFSAAGMSVTQEGEMILKELVAYVGKLKNLDDLGKQIASRFHIDKVVIISGDCDRDEIVKKELGRATARILEKILGDEEDNIIAVSGGSTLAEVASNIHANKPNTIVVPARGGLGDKVEWQANTIAAVLAHRLKCKYKQLYLPDGVSEELLNKILEEDIGVRSVVNLVKKADVLVYGMSRADVMTSRRSFSDELIKKTECKSAVGEAIGQYFSQAGEVVHVTNNAGLVMTDFDTIKKIIGVAGGSSKAEAIFAVISASKLNYLVTDENAARRIVQLVNEREDKDVII